MKIRAATLSDADGMSRVLKDIVGSTGRQRPTDTAFVVSRYIDNPLNIRCSVALDDDGEVLGFQSLIQAAADNPYGVPQGWAIIGTHISPRAHRQGIGSALFSSSKEAALQAGFDKIDAYIAVDNCSAIGFYDTLGFRTYREPPGIIQKVFVISNIIDGAARASA